MLSKIIKYIDENNLFDRSHKLIVGLSGGADSMALIDILHSLRYNCVAAHCNFHLRGEESDADEQFVKDWCIQKGIELVTIDFDTHKYAIDNKVSIEMAARDLRYNWFEQIRITYNADYIAVAHHENDSVETVLINMIRGTGISGLTGIMPKNGKVVRPLLCVNRKEIEDYLNLKSISYRTDTTNLQDIYMRNYIRLNILPMLEELNPSVHNSIIRTAKNLTEVEKIYQSSIKRDINKVKNSNIIDINLLRQTISPQSVLFEILDPLGFSVSVIEDVLNSFDSTPGKVFLSHSHRLMKDRDCFIIDTIKDNSSSENIYYIYKDSHNHSADTLPLNMEISIVSKSSIKINKGNQYLYADIDSLSFPLKLRKWRHGDWFIPFGMNGKKKLSDFFTDQKLSLKDKEDTWILTSDEDVVWVVGYRSDDRYKVTNATENILQIELI